MAISKATISWMKTRIGELESRLNRADAHLQNSLALLNADYKKRGALKTELSDALYALREIEGAPQFFGDSTQEKSS